jgi:hypothetical protein
MQASLYRIERKLLILLDRPRFVALTPLLPTRFPSSSGDNSARPMLLQAFWAALLLRADIHKDRIQDMERSYPSLLHMDLPYVRKISAWPQTPGGRHELEFRLISRMAQNPKYWTVNGFLYTGIWQKKPNYRQVPGGWNAVVMDFVISIPNIMHLLPLSSHNT